jgi:hypothetical protein
VIEGAAEALRALSSKPYTIKYHLRTLGGPFVRNQTHFSTFQLPAGVDWRQLGRLPGGMLRCTILFQEVHRVGPCRGVRDEMRSVAPRSPAVAGGGPVPGQSWKKSPGGHDCASDRANIHLFKIKPGFHVVMAGSRWAFLPWRRESRSGRIAPPTYLIGSPVDLLRSSPAFPVEPRCH